MSEKLKRCRFLRITPFPICEKHSITWLLAQCSRDYKNCKDYEPHCGAKMGGLTMEDYKKLIEALRQRAHREDEWHEHGGDIINDAADAIEELQQIADHYEQTAKDYWKQACEYKEQLPKHGAWIEIIEDVCECSVCGSKWLGVGGYIYCPHCGAKMSSTQSNDSNALNALDNAQDAPIITPCRGCDDYDGYGGCKSNGGCGKARMGVQDANT